MAQSLMWKEQPVFLFSPTCMLLLLRVPILPFMWWLWKSSASQLIWKMTFLSAQTFPEEVFLPVEYTESGCPLCAAKTKKNKTACLVTFVQQLVCKQDWDSEPVSDQCRYCCTSLNVLSTECSNNCCFLTRIRVLHDQ